MQKFRSAICGFTGKLIYSNKFEQHRFKISSNKFIKINSSLIMPDITLAKHTDHRFKLPEVLIDGWIKMNGTRKTNS